MDTSALIAIVQDEADRPAMLEAVVTANAARLSAASLLEAAIVVDAKHNPALSRRFDELIDSAGFIIEPVTHVQARLAREAYRDFGKGSGHPARLNFGDCLTYALAKDKGEPLLFKGTDFGRTDLSPVLA